MGVKKENIKLHRIIDGLKMKLVHRYIYGDYESSIVLENERKKYKFVSRKKFKDGTYCIYATNSKKKFTGNSNKVNYKYLDTDSAIRRSVGLREVFTIDNGERIKIWTGTQLEFDNYKRVVKNLKVKSI